MLEKDIHFFVQIFIIAEGGDASNCLSLQLDDNNTPSKEVFIVSQSTTLVLENSFYLKAAILEWLMAASLILSPELVNLPGMTGFYCGAIIAMFGCYRFYQWLDTRSEIKSLSANTFFKVKASRIKNFAENNKGKIYVGKGYVWETKHTSRYHQVRSLPETKKHIDLENQVGGLSYVHNLGMAEEDDIVFPLDELKHSVIAGTTRVGKTRMFELLSYQIINQDECLIFIDPKGDSEMLDCIYQSCVDAGKEQDFVYFSLAHPKKSASFNPVSNFMKPNDVASRVTSIMPQDGSSKPFTDFCWKVLVAVADVLMALNEPITLKKLHKYSLQDMETLYNKAIETAKEMKPGPQKDYLDSATKNLELLVNHPKEHFSKMITSLEPVMTALATGEVGELISSERPQIDWADIVKGKKICYFYLASMIDTFTSSAVGKLTVQDFLNYIGQVYAFETESHPVNLFVDEFYNVMFPGYVDLLNKAGGADVRVFLAMQTTADITTASQESMTKQILGNINNKFYMRVPEEELAKEFCSLFGQVKIKQVEEARNISADPKSARELFKSGWSMTNKEQEVDLITPEMLMGLPKGQAFCFTQGRNPYKIRIPLMNKDYKIKKSFSEMVNSDSDLETQQKHSWNDPKQEDSAWEEQDGTGNVVEPSDFNFKR